MKGQELKENNQVHILRQSIEDAGIEEAAFTKIHNSPCEKLIQGSR